MTRPAKPARRKRNRHGATQPEAERASKQVLLRLLPGHIAYLDELAEWRQTTRSGLVAWLLSAAMAKLDAATE